MANADAAQARKARRWQRIVPFLVGVSGLAATGASMLLACTHVSQETDPQRAIESAPSAAPSAAPPAPPPGPEPIIVSIDALPLSAKIFVDGVALGYNPYEAEHPRDAQSHVIRIEAPGYEPQSTSVPFSGPVHMHVELVALRGSAQPTAHGPPTARPPAAPSASAAPK